MSNIDTVRRIYEAFSRMDVPAILEHLAEDVAWEYAYPERGVPWLSPRHGRTGAGAFFASLAELDIRKFEIRGMLGEGPLVVTLIEIEAVVRKTGKTIHEVDETHIWRFDDRGRVKQFRHVVDTLQHQRAWEP